MSEETVAIVEALFAGARSADKQTLLAALPELIAQACDPQIKWVEDLERADGKVHRGHAGTMRAGKILRYREFYDEQAALAAAGLAE